jgi:outer membrane protein OmpA-like peptidoglycan-associated protein
MEDGQTNLQRRDKNKYKIRIGASILDLGSITFKKGNGTYDFLADTANWKVKGTQVGSNPILGVDSIVSRVFPNHSDKKNTFTFALPTAFSVQIDYNIYKDFYLNFTSYTSPRWLDIESKVHQVSYYSLTPRWDSKWFGVFVPLAINGYGQAIMGLALRAGPLVIGSSQILSGLLSDNMYGMDIHAAVKIPIFAHKPPRDRDHDGVSDKYDKCPNKKGTWEHHGCPDTDGDGVYDDVDKCPTIPGPVENNGCPWPDRDKDGVADRLDSCPDVAGPKENHGCPWGDADKDGVTDNLDSCKFIPGPAANHGCPWPDADNDGIPDYLDNCPHVAGPVANHGCPWGDADNDGVPDNLDSCPHTPGPVSNHGCPVLAKKTQEIVNTAFNDLEFELNSATIKQSSLISIDELAKLMRDHPKFRIKLTGYTDNVGTEEKNLKLSQDRANAVRNALMAKGTDKDKIKVEYHGSANPVATNSTEEGRAKNRRVEMKITFD